VSKYRAKKNSIVRKKTMREDWKKQPDRPYRQRNTREGKTSKKKFLRNAR